MRAGQLRHVIEVQEAIETKNSVGERVKEFVYRGRFSGAIVSVSGEERFSTDQAKAVVDTKIKMRANAAPYLKPTMRLKYGDRIFDIEAIIPDERNISKEISCKEVA